MKPPSQPLHLDMNSMTDVDYNFKFYQNATFMKTHFIITYYFLKIGGLIQSSQDEGRDVSICVECSGMNMTNF